MKEWMKILAPIFAALGAVGGAGNYALERLDTRLSAIEKSVAVIEWRVDERFGPPAWKRAE